MIRRLILAVVAAVVLGAPARGEDSHTDLLKPLEQRMRRGEFPGVHSLIVVKGDRTLAEYYFEGRDEIRGRPLGIVKFEADTLHDVRSVTKSIVGLLVGVAVEEGAIASLDTPVLDYFPEYEDLNTAERRRVTLRHLLSMTSGLHWDEGTYPYTDPRNSETAMDFAADPYRYVLSQPFDTGPGDRFKYSGGDVAVMAAVLARATGMPLDIYADHKLFRPLGIAKVEWHRDGRGVPHAASGLRMTSRDMAKVGQTILARGRWNDRQVIPAHWVKEALTPKAQIQSDPNCGARYGYFWWLFPGCQISRPTPWAAADGNGGQRIIVVPERDLVLVITAGNYNSRSQGEAPDAILTTVLAALP